MEKIRKQSLVDQIYSKLREEILFLRMPLGSRINVNEIQADLGVSSTPLREALNRLQQEGLVTLQANVGASVISLDAHDVEEIQEMAYILQSAAVRLSMERGDRELMAALIEEEVGNYRSACSAEECVKAVFNLIGVFYHNCGNQRLDNSMIALQGQVLLLRFIYAECPECRENGDLLEKILQGVRTGETVEILDALLAYQKRSGPAILEWLNAGKNGK